MALKLKKRELPMVQFRRVLPADFGPGDGVECFIEVDARAGGAINQAYAVGSEALLLKSRVLDRKVNKVEDDETSVHQNHKNIMSVFRDKFGVMYDACVIEWRCNIVVVNDAGKEVPITCDRANFLDLTELRIPEIAQAMVDLETEVLKAGVLVVESDEETVKN